MELHPDSAPADPNLIAIDRAGLPADTVAWLRQVAAQVEPRLDRATPGWREGGQPEAARAAVFGLLLGRLAGRYPHMGDELSRTAEAHASFDALGQGTRLQTLGELAGHPDRAGTWLSGMIAVDRPEQVLALLEG